MKTTSLIAAGLFTISAMSVSDSNTGFAVDKNSDQDILISCAWVTYCGDPDIYSPVPQPSDKKVDTKDKAKDDKVS